MAARHVIERVIWKVVQGDACGRVAAEVFGALQEAGFQIVERSPE